MLYSTIVQRNDEGLTQIYEAAREYEELNAQEAILTCKFSLKKVKQTLNLVRQYHLQLNNESMDLAEFSENFIEDYATDHNECFRVAERLVRKIGTTITGSMKIFKAYCSVVRKRKEGTDNVVPVLDYTRLTSRKFHGMFFGEDMYREEVKTLLHEQATFFYHLIATLALCKDMIREEERVRGDYAALKRIFDDSCRKVLDGIRDVVKTFNNVQMVSPEELEERRKHARPLSEWLSEDYHRHDKNWLRREAYILRCVDGSRYGLDEEAAQFFPGNPRHGVEVCKAIGMLDSLGLPVQMVKGHEQFRAIEMVSFLKWAAVSHVDEHGNVVNEEKERRFYLSYLHKHYKGKFRLPTWQAVCRQRTNFHGTFTFEQLSSAFAQYLPWKEVSEGNGQKEAVLVPFDVKHAI